MYDGRLSLSRRGERRDLIMTGASSCRTTEPAACLVSRVDLATQPRCSSCPPRLAGCACRSPPRLRPCPGQARAKRGPVGQRRPGASRSRSRPATREPRAAPRTMRSPQARTFLVLTSFTPSLFTPFVQSRMKVACAAVSLAWVSLAGEFVAGGLAGQGLRLPEAERGWRRGRESVGRQSRAERRKLCKRCC